MEPRSHRIGIGIVTAVGIGAIAVIAVILVLSYSPLEALSPALFDRYSPRIELMSEGERYQGQHLGSTFGIEPLPDLQDPSLLNVTSVSTDEIVLQSGSTADFEIRESPEPLGEPESLSVTAFTGTGSPVKVLSVHEDSLAGEFALDLQQGRYILIATATWTAELPEETVNGYVVYGYRVAIE